jgi:putative Mg2+ transporter-C (MgtC) family protein
MLVGLGATVITLSGMSFAGPGSVLDIGRIVAGIVTGIGFLGAGAIIRTSDMVRGLTTAACIWFVAAMGIVCALGLYTLAAVSTGIALFVLVVLAFLEDLIPPLSIRKILVSGSGREPSGIRDDCLPLLGGAGLKVLDCLVEYRSGEVGSRLLFHTRTRKCADAAELVRQLSAVEGVTEVIWEWKQETP